MDRTETQQTPAQSGKRQGPVRWSGLAAFVVIAGGLFAGGWLFADTLARWSLQSTLSRIQGAEVNIEAVDVGWQPFGLTVNGLAMTDPAAPGTNAVAVDRIEARVDFLALLTGKVTIESLEAIGVSTGTDRPSPGWVRQKAERPENTGAENRPAVTERLAGTVSLPDADRALSAVQPLAIQTRAADASTTRDRVSQSIARSVTTAPGSDAIARYQSRVQALRERESSSLDSIVRTRNDLDALRQSVSADRQALTGALAEVRRGQAELEQALTALQNAPLNDLERVRERYNLSPQGQLALAELLLGPRWATWLSTGQAWYERAQPWIQRVSDRQAERASNPAAPVGRYVRFPEADPRPGFWLQRAAIEWVSDAGTWHAELRDLTSDQSVIDRPTQLNARSDSLTNADAGELALVWDNRGADEPAMSFVFTLDEWALSEWSMGGADLGVSLDRANTGLTIDARRSSAWSGTLDWTFRNTVFSSSADDSAGMDGLIADALQSVSGFDVSAALGGSALVPTTRWTSNLGRQVGSSVQAALNARYQAFESEVRAELNRRVGTLAEPIRAEVDVAREQAAELETRLADLNRQVQAGIDSLDRQLTQRRTEIERRLQQQRQGLEDRARDQLRNFSF